MCGSAAKRDICVVPIDAGSWNVLDAVAIPNVLSAPSS